VVHIFIHYCIRRRIGWGRISRRAWTKLRTLF